MTDEEKRNVDNFYAEYYIYEKIMADEVEPGDTIVDESEVPNGKYTVD
jgi:hypothetical protein